MHFHRILIILSISFILVGCLPQTTKKEAFPQMYNEHPLSILVLPPINETTAADAKEYYSATIAEPLTLMGYYVFPIEVTTEVLKNEGFYDTELLINTPPTKVQTILWSRLCSLCENLEVEHILFCDRWKSHR